MFVVAVATILRLRPKDIEAEYREDHPARQLDLELVSAHEARDRGGSVGGDHRNHAVRQNRAEARREAAPEAALQRSLDADDVNRTHGRGDEHADKDAKYGKSRRIDDRLCPHRPLQPSKSSGGEGAAFPAIVTPKTGSGMTGKPPRRNHRHPCRENAMNCNRRRK